MGLNFEKPKQNFNEADAEKLVKAALGPNAFDRKEKKMVFEFGEQTGELETSLHNLYFDLFSDLKANQDGGDDYRQELYKAINETEQQLFSLWRQTYPQKPEIRIHQEVGNRVEEIKQTVLAKINPERAAASQDEKQDSRHVA